MPSMPQTGGVYLDANILIASVDTTDLHADNVHKALVVLSRFTGVAFFISEWTLVEMKKVFVREKGWPVSRANKVAARIRKTMLLRGHALTLLPVTHSPKYEYKDFFDSLFKFLTIDQKIGPRIDGLADAIHCTIMKNNSIALILSTDASSGLGLAPNQILLEPKELAKDY